MRKFPLGNFKLASKRTCAQLIVATIPHPYPPSLPPLQVANSTACNTTMPYQSYEANAEAIMFNPQFLEGIRPYRCGLQSCAIAAA